MWWGYSREGGDVGVCPFCYSCPRPLTRQHRRYTKLQEVSKCRTNRNCNSILLTESVEAQSKVCKVCPRLATRANVVSVEEVCKACCRR